MLSFAKIMVDLVALAMTVTALPPSLGFGAFDVSRADAAGSRAAQLAQASNSTSTGSTISTAKWSQDLAFAVDYYPSQWPDSMWEDDAKRMAQAGIKYVRIGEFDWEIIEPTEGEYNFDLLDRSIDILGQQGLKVILGTPTATPPIWAIKNHDVLGEDAMHFKRNFGSRRHYSFSSPDYRKLSKSITRKLAERYGKNKYIGAWQLDNEFGCHATTRTYDEHARKAFQAWLSDRYDANITKLNEMQGRVFWSSSYRSFEDIDLPTQEVTESNPALRLDFYTFSSDQVADFALEQVKAIRELSPGKPITTNFMAFFQEFDHHAFAKKTGIDFATWDNYPLGNTESVSWISDEDKIRYARTGRPDAQSMNHALYRGIAFASSSNTEGASGVMEQQPGPVNWAQFNPSPLPGQVRLWLHEIFAHAGSLANIFRWREVPFGQEQMHAAMLRRDNVEDLAYTEQQQARADVAAMREAGLLTGNGSALSWADTSVKEPAKIAMVVDYQAGFLLEANPQGGVWDTNTFKDFGFNYQRLLDSWWSALRRLALDADIIGPDTPLGNYSLVIVPTMPKVSPEFNSHLAKYTGHLIVGPRTASKVDTLSIPEGLPPAAGALRQRLPMKVTRVESLRSGLADSVSVGDAEASPVEVWSEWLECYRDGKNASEAAPAVFRKYRDGLPAACEHVDVDGKTSTYIGWYASADAMLPTFARLAAKANITTILNGTPDTANDLGLHVRFNRHGKALYAFNYGAEAQKVPVNLPDGATLVVGGEGDLEPSGVRIWKL